jgi:DNA polymerase I-like protein with 3'-5' exonuclease and polymerase domains
VPARKRKLDNSDSLQLPMFLPESDWRPPRLGDLPEWPRNGRVSIDIETKDPHLKELGPGPRRKTGFIAGVGFAIEDGPSFYLPVRHKGGNNVENPDAVWAYLATQARSFQGILTGANFGYDLDWLSTAEGVDFLRGNCTLRDVQVADPLIYEMHDRYNLEVLCERWGLPGKDEVLLREAASVYNTDPKLGLWKIPGRFVGPYGERDCVAPLQVLRKQEKQIEEQGLWDIFNLECSVQPVLIKMRQRGVRVDEDRLAQVEDWSQQQEAEALAAVHHLTGVKHTVGDVWKAKAIAPALEHIGVVLKSTAQGAPQIDKDVLAGVDHPVAEKLAWARKVNKLRTTFAQSVRTHMVNGRIHCTLNQLRRTKEDGNTRGAAYGRLSCENPNLQQQPARDEFAKMWRSIYLPEEGALWGCDDYSQQEPRMLVHFAELLELTGAEAAAERYRTDPSTDSHQMMADLTGIPRKRAKIIYLGLCYGMGGGKLCRSLDLPTRWAVFSRGKQTSFHYFESRLEALEHSSQFGGRVFEAAGEEGQRILDTFNKRAPFVREMAKRAEAVAKRRGYIKTVGGRRCRFPQAKNGGYDWAHKALNRLIQGSSADQTKKALVECDRQGYFIQLQVHDEIDGSFQSRGAAEAMGEVMANVYELGVPFKVDVEVGSSWGEAA